jgi:hypothetical protein
MKLKFWLLFLLFISFAAAAAAQDEASLKKPTGGADDIFTDKEKTFSIDLPQKPFNTKTDAGADKNGKDSGATQYKWLLREGIFFVAVTKFNNISFDRKTDVDAYMADLAAELKKISKFRIASQKELKLGDVYGGEIVRANEAGEKIILRVFARGQMMYTLTAIVDKEVDDAEALMIAALDSFKFAAALEKVTTKSP